MSAFQQLPTDILLDPSDWYMASWRNLPPMPRPAAVPFDLAACCARLAKAQTRAGWEWGLAKIGPCLSPEEGRFWLEAFNLAGNAKATPTSISTKITKAWPLPRLSEQLCFGRIKLYSSSRPPELVPALASQVDISALIRVLLSPCVAEGQVYLDATFLLDGFRSFVRPWITTGELLAARKVLAAHLARHPAADVLLNQFIVGLMASLGMSKELAVLVETGTTSGIPYFMPMFQEAIFGLGDPAEVIPTLRQFNQRLARPEHVRALFAHLEGEAIPYIRDAILACGNRAEAEMLTSALGLAHRPETARAMLVLARSSRGPAPAQRWLDEHRELAIPGLLPMTGDAQFGEAALNYLRGQVRAGHQAAIDQHLVTMNAETATHIRRSLETTAAMQAVDDVAVPAWFPPNPKRNPRLPAWLDAATLPPLRISGMRLPPAQVTTLLALLRETPLENSLALFAEIKKNAEPRLLDAFVWAVFERWQSGSGDPKDKWALLALGHLGGDGVCLPLAAQLGEWPGKSQHQRALLGVQCLLKIGTPLALLCVSRLETSQFPSLSQEASTQMRLLAKKRKVSEQQLEDQLVPDLGLDRNGYRQLVSSRQTYRLTLGPDREARLLDERRQYLSELPELTQEDDPSRVEAARAEWALFKQQTQEVMRIQTQRLQNAMFRWRRWTFPEFEAYLVRHPFLNYLSRAVLWAAFESISKVRFAFRVTESRTCVDAAGAPVTLDPSWPIGVVHPVLLPPDERLIWTDILQEQGLSLPDWQLPRTVYTLTEAEKSQHLLNRWAGTQLNFTSLGVETSRLDYHTGAEQRSHLCCRVRYVGELNLTVYALHTPLSQEERWQSVQKPVELLGCHFRKGNTLSRVPNEKEALPLGEIDLVLLDEVIRNMNTVTQTARFAKISG